MRGAELVTVLLIFSHAALAAKHLLQVLDPDPDLPVCNATGVFFCQKVNISFQAIREETLLIFPENHLLERVSAVSPTLQSTTYDFEGSDDDIYAILTVTDSNILEANLHLGTEDDIYVQSCGSDCHVLIKMQILSNSSATDDDAPQILNRLPRSPDPMTAQPSSSRTTAPSTYLSASCYYTGEYAWFVGEPVAAIDTEIGDLNRVLTNSELPIRFACLCRKRVDLVEAYNASARLNEIAARFGTWSNALKTADVAVFFYRWATPAGVCGRALDVDPLATANAPIVFVGRGCNTHSLAHAVGHVLGARHNVEVDSEDGYNHAYLVPNTNGLTVMGVRRGPHAHMLARFSTSGGDGRYLGRRIGDAASADNARQLLEAHERYARLGDESMRCDVHGEDPCRDFPAVACADRVRHFPCDAFFATRFYCPASCGVCRPCGPEALDGVCMELAANGMCSWGLVSAFCAEECRCYA